LAAIGEPDAGYVGGTTLIDLSGIPSGLPGWNLLNSVTDGVLTVSFSPGVLKLSSGEWANWSSPPFAETAVPDVLFSDFARDLTLQLSRSVSTFGFEIAPNPWSQHTYTVEFIDSSVPTIVETIVQDAHGLEGARLVASELPATVDRIRISGSADFAIAQIRYAFEAEPLLSVQIEIPGTVNLKSHGLIPVVLLGSAEMDVTEVDVGTVAFGPGSAAPSHARSNGNGNREVGHLEDSNGDGVPDRVFHFNLMDTGLTPESREVCLVGATLEGFPFQGCTPVRVIHPGRLK
jgi:hypothetical protein